jgi:predicted nucleic acid-binding protein
VLRVTADSNIYISALQFGGQPLRLLELARDQKIVLTTSAVILQDDPDDNAILECAVAGRQI